MSVCNVHSAGICLTCGCDVQTLCCGNTVSDHLVQVTSTDVRLVDATSHEMVHQWRPPPGLNVNVASVNPSQVRDILYQSCFSTASPQCVTCYWLCHTFRMSCHKYLDVLGSEMASSFIF